MTIQSIGSPGTGAPNPGQIDAGLNQGAARDGLSQLARQAQTGSPVEQGQALRELDRLTGDRGASGALARGEEVATQRAATEQPEMCTVEVRYRPVIGPTNHAFIVTTDGDSQNYFRGGPEGNGFGSGSSGSGASSASSNTSGGDRANRGWGNIVTRSGAYVEGTIDWTTNPTGQQTVQTMPGNCDAIEAQFAREAEAITEARIPYSPFGPNSNTTVRELLESAGITGVEPVVWSPGWNAEMPR